DPAAGKPAQGAGHKGLRVDRAIAAQHFDIRGAARIVDAHVDVLPADAPGAVPPVAGDAVAEAADATELLDIDMPERPPPRAFVPTHGLRGADGLQPPEPVAAQDGPDRRARQAEAARDRRAGPPLDAQRDNGHLLGGDRAMGDPARPGSAIVQG